MLARILEHKITFFVSIALAVIVVGVGGWYIFAPKSEHYETTTASVRDIQESITGTGDVDSDQHVSLAFRSPGTVASINVKVGDAVKAGQILASLDNSTLYAQLAGAKADVLSAEANLSTANRGATNETRAVSNESVTTTATALATAENDAFLKASDAVLTKADTLFMGGSSPSPSFTIQTDNYTNLININNARVDITSRLNRFKAALAGPATDPRVTSEIASDLTAVNDFMNAVSTQVLRLSTANSGLSQSQLSAYTTTINAAASEANAAAQTYHSAYQAWRTAEDQKAVGTASSPPETVQTAEAAVAKAQAAVASISSQISNGVLTAPFDGVVSSVALKQSQTVTAGTPGIDIISGGQYKVDIMVPENEVAAISAGQSVTMSFDAYGSEITATGTVASIDLSPTTSKGVSAYKTTITFPSSDSRIRTGMTANVSISGPSASGVVSVPSSAIIKNGSGSFVLVEGQNGKFTKQAVDAGLTDGTYTEIRSGISNGQTVAVFGK